jgi:imidazolonepropionase-like amidohydrolase
MSPRPFRSHLVVRIATLISGPGAAPVPGATIVIRDGLISDGPAPDDAQELDAAGAVVTAGLWNCHVHNVLAMLTTGPAEALGTGTGTVAPGEPGDLVLLDKLATVTDLASVRATVRAGQVTWARGPAPAVAP